MGDTNSPTFVLRSRRIVTPHGMRDGAVAVSNGIITAIGQHPQIAPGAIILDVGDLVVSPGVVDPHVHINEPGRTEWEGFETATRAAAAGGITSLVDMPLNSSPITTGVESFKTKLVAAQGKLFVDCGFHAGLVPENAKNIGDLLDSGVLGVKVFLVHSGIDEFPNAAETDLRLAMPAIAERGLPLLVHAELQNGSEGHNLNPSRYADYLASRPCKWENEAIALMIHLCKEFGCRVHIVHLSSSESLQQLREAKSAGLPMSVETCPHYLFFSSEEIPDGDTRFKCAPPIRERENNEQLWEALKEGVIDFVASDHSPCPPEMKLLESGDFMKAWGGIASLQFGLSIMWTEAKKRGFQITDIARWMSANPARLVGLEQKKGAIAPGYDADFVIWDPEESFVVTPSIIQHRHKITPYEGRTLFGKVHTTFVRGQKVFEEGKFASPFGKLLMRNQSH